MQITWLGHASFLLETDSGMKIVTDPYGQKIMPHYAPAADLVTVSHEHFDHADTDSLPRCGEILRGAKEWEAPGLHVQGYACWHDDVQGKKRGPNTVFVFEADGKKIAHLGDLGEPLTPALREALQDLDLLMLPVGGVYTVDGKAAAGIVEMLKPRYAVPMHYRLPEHSMQVLSGPEPFLDALGKGIAVTKVPVITFTEPEGVLIPEKR